MYAKKEANGNRDKRTSRRAAARAGGVVTPAAVPPAPVLAAATAEREVPLRSGAPPVRSTTATKAAAAAAEAFRYLSINFFFFLFIERNLCLLCTEQGKRVRLADEFVFQPVSKCGMALETPMYC
jgi:hypothetical protein